MQQLPKQFADIDIGDELGPGARAPSTAIVQLYVEAAGLQELRFFLDHEQALKHGFEQPTVPGTLTASFLAQLVRDYFVGWQLRAVYTTFRAPALHGEPLTV